MSEEENKESAIGQVRPAFVYMVECADGTLYTGWTWDVTARVKRHNAGKGAKYTRAHLPVKLVYHEELPDEQAARRREYALKQLTRSQKLKLVAKAVMSDE